MKRKNLTTPVLHLVFAALCGAQSAPPTQDPSEQKSNDSPASAPAPAALPTPAITGPLRALPPAEFEAGPVGKLSVHGVLSGTGMWQGNSLPGDEPTRADLSNAQAFIQKTDGWFQFYLQAGAYAIPDLAARFSAADQSVTDFFGPVPVGFIKLQAGKNTSFQIGALPTLIGAESTFSFQNMNVERGLLWNQEPAVSRGVQLNQTFGKFTASLSWNDGFYSNRYSWLSGALTYTTGHHSLSFLGGGNMGETAYQTVATPVQNNSSIYNVVYTYSNGPWVIQPYFQYTNVPTNLRIGVTKGASTKGGAILVSRTFKNGFSLAERAEYIKSSGSNAEQSVNLILGPGSGGWSGTVTPTFQKGGFFVRCDLSFVRATNYTSGSAFGPAGTNENQPRAIAEVGFMFGNNIVRP